MSPSQRGGYVCLCLSACLWRCSMSLGKPISLLEQQNPWCWSKEVGQGIKLVTPSLAADATARISSLEMLSPGPFLPLPPWESARLLEQQKEEEEEEEGCHTSACSSGDFTAPVPAPWASYHILLLCRRISLCCCVLSFFPHGSYLTHGRKVLHLQLYLIYLSPCKTQEQHIAHALSSANLLSSLGTPWFRDVAELFCKRNKHHPSRIRADGCILGTFPKGEISNLSFNSLLILVLKNKFFLNKCCSTESWGEEIV